MTWSRTRTSSHLVVAGLALALAAGCLRLPPLPEDPVPAVRDLVARKEFDAAEALLTSYQTERGTTPALVDGLSMLAQGMNAAGERTRAEGIARTTHELTSKLLMARPVDEEPRAPLALGRAIEIWAQAVARRGDTHGAMTLLAGELETYRGTSVEKRIQRNIHLLALKGQPAPPLDLSEHLGVAAPPLDAFKGRVVVLFFWAHYCADCKAQAPVLARVAEKYRSQGVAIVAPTQRYGYVAEGKDAAPNEETRYIEDVRRAYYPVLTDAPVPLSEVNHRRYGVSSTPTLVLLDRHGRVALYHPGTMTEAELDAEIQALIAADARPA